MKLSAKHIMLILMSTLLVLVVVMSCIVFNQISGMLQMGGNTPKPSAPSQPQVPSSVPETSSQPIVTEPGHEHVYVKEQTVSPTCDAQGYSLFVCSCGKPDIRDFTPARGHVYGEETVVAPTCVIDGWTERTCSRCNQVARTNPVPASHSFGQWFVGNNPAQEQSVCSVCSATDIRPTDTSLNWVLHIMPQVSESTFAHYQVIVDLPDTDEDLVHDMYLAEGILATGYDYTEDGFVLSYTLNGNPLQFTFPSYAKERTFYTDGTVSIGQPVDTPDPDPEPTPDPNPSESEPSESEPTDSEPSDSAEE